MIANENTKHKTREKFRQMQNHTAGISKSIIPGKKMETETISLRTLGPVQLHGNDEKTKLSCNFLCVCYQESCRTYSFNFPIEKQFLAK